MNSTLKNITGLLIALVFIFVGYNIFIQGDGLEYIAGSAVNDEKLAKAQVFIKRSATLDQIKIDTSIFEDPLFLSYRSFSNPIAELPYNYQRNPFIESTQISNF